MTHRFDNRTVLVTGSTRGLGKQMALSFAQAGARVAMNYHGDDQAAAAAFAELQATDGPHCLMRTDVTNEEAIAGLVGEIETQLGGIDILVLNATCDQPELKIDEYDWAFFQQMVDFFLKSPFLLTKACLPHMRAQQWGRIVHITSEVVAESRSEFCPYVAAKGGQTSLARSNARELASDGITVNCVAPGWVPVERHAGATLEERAGYLASSPAGKFGEPSDVAAAALYLASEEASFVTGATIAVNGGRTIS